MSHHVNISGNVNLPASLSIAFAVPVNPASFFLRYWCANEGITIAPLTRVRVATSVDETLPTRACENRAASVGRYTILPCA